MARPVLHTRVCVCVCVCVCVRLRLDFGFSVPGLDWLPGGAEPYCRAWLSFQQTLPDLAGDHYHAADLPAGLCVRHISSTYSLLSGQPYLSPGHPRAHRMMSRPIMSTASLVASLAARASTSRQRPCLSILPSGLSDQGHDHQGHGTSSLSRPLSRASPTLLPLLSRNLGKGGMPPASGAPSHHPCQPSMPRASMIGIEGEHIAW